ncbi:transporter [Candidatus Woesearchaeota archaeon]|nr:transporter [Candidatus Woesearchaeota archaeon]
MPHLKQIFLSVILVVIAELSLKTGVKNLVFSHVNLKAFFISAFSSPFVIIGFILIALSSIIWIATLSKTDLSYAYPFVSAGYVITAILSVIIFSEHSSLLKWTSIAVISCGVFLMSKS